MDTRVSIWRQHDRLFFVLVEHANKILLFCQHIFTRIQDIRTRMKWLIKQFNFFATMILDAFFVCCLEWPWRLGISNVGKNFIVVAAYWLMSPNMAFCFFNHFLENNFNFDCLMFIDQGLIWFERCSYINFFLPIFGL